MKSQIAITAICSLGLVILLGLNVWESGYESGLKAGSGANQCAPIVVYRRGVDTLSPEELRRLANARARLARVK